MPYLSYHYPTNLLIDPLIYPRNLPFPSPSYTDFPPFAKCMLEYDKDFAIIGPTYAFLGVEKGEGGWKEGGI